MEGCIASRRTERLSPYPLSPLATSPTARSRLGTGSRTANASAAVNSTPDAALAKTTWPGSRSASARESVSSTPHASVATSTASSPTSARLQTESGARMRAPKAVARHRQEAAGTASADVGAQPVSRRITPHHDHLVVSPPPLRCRGRSVPLESFGDSWWHHSG